MCKYSSQHLTELPFLMFFLTFKCKKAERNVRSVSIFLFPSRRTMEIFVSAKEVLSEVEMMTSPYDGRMSCVLTYTRNSLLHISILLRHVQSKEKITYLFEDL